MDPDSHLGPDHYQQAWQSHSSQTRVTIDAVLLLKEVQRSQRNFRALIFWRDFREVGLALLMLPLWFYLGAVLPLPWTWYLTVPVLVWYAVFMLAHRMRHKQKPHEPGKPLLHCVKDSLTEVEHQIWLLRNIFWWSLLPMSISALAFFVHVGWLSLPGGWPVAIALMVAAGVAMSALAFVYSLNQHAVRSQLEPRRQELLTLLTSLRDETTGEAADDHIALPGLPFTEERLSTPYTSPGRVAIGMFGIVVIMLFLVVMLVVTLVAMVKTDPYLLTGEGYPKRSPFAAVRWRESQPEVKLGEEWFRLVSLDELSAAEIVAFSQSTYGDKWQKRFEEDLVELLTRMGHPPQDQATLVVQSLMSPQTRTFEDTPMTYANRRAIRAAGQERARK